MAAHASLTFFATRYWISLMRRRPPLFLFGEDVSEPTRPPRASRACYGAGNQRGAGMLSVPVRGVKLVYEVLGQNGPKSGPQSSPWVVISPGGRRGLASDRALGMLLAEAGFRVLV